jgi:hypothetical protein
MSAALLSLVLAVAAAGAEAPPSAAIDEQSKEPGRPAQTERKAATAADAAREASPAQDAEISYETVLKSPDDIELNRRFARQQLRKGDVRGAASTLERLTLLRPEDPSVRLLYAVVLYRLDDAVACERELEILLAMKNLPDRVAAEARDYLVRARARMRDAHFDARLSFGAGLDDNVNAAPQGQAVRFAGATLSLPETSRAKADTNVQFIGSLGASYDFSGPKGHSIHGRVTAYRGEQRVYDILDLQAYSAETGATLRLRGWEFRPTVSFDHVLLSQSTYLRGLNAGLRVERRLSRRWTAFADFVRADQDFVNTPQIRTAEQREGEQFDLEGGAILAATPADRFTFTLRHRRKLALARSFAYRREGATIEWLKAFRRGMFVVTTVEGQFDRYDRPDPFVDARLPRHDDAGRFEVLAGAPLSLAWGALKGFTATVGVEHFRQGSSVPNYEYFNNRATLLLTYQWSR